MRRAGFVIVALVLAGCSSGSKPSSAPPTTAGSNATGVAFLHQWCPKAEADYRNIYTVVGAPGGPAPDMADVAEADELLARGPFPSMKATIDHTSLAQRPRTAVAEIGVAANWCSSHGY